MPRAALAAVACLCLLGAAPAQAGLTLDVGWQQEHQFDTDLVAAGYGIGMGFDMGRSFFFGASYSNVRTESFEDALDGAEGRLDYSSLGASLGAVWPWTHWLGLTATGGYALSTTRGRDGFRGDSPARFHGPTGSLSLWFQPASRISLSAGGGYSHLGGVPGWDTSAGLGLRLWQELWLDGSYWRAESADGWMAGLRTYLPSD